jgi:hypothetical protein
MIETKTDKIRIYFMIFQNLNASERVIGFPVGEGGYPPRQFLTTAIPEENVLSLLSA